MNQKKKIYVAGCGGMLGEAFYKIFGDEYELKCTDIDVNETWLSYLDFRDYESYLSDVSEFKPDYLFHIGAHTDLEYCELHPKDTYETNFRSVEHGVKIANELDVPILYIGTAGIFNGEKDFYHEEDFQKEADAVSLNEIIQDAWQYSIMENLSMEKNLSFKSNNTKDEVDEIEVFVDKKIVAEELFGNLFKNSKEHGFKKDIENPLVSIVIDNEDDRYLTIEYFDNGKGYSKRIFDKIYTTLTDDVKKVFPIGALIIGIIIRRLSNQEPEPIMEKKRVKGIKFKLPKFTDLGSGNE